MSDINCESCGEPWERYFLETEGLKYNPDKYDVIKSGDYISRLKSCPSCSPSCPNCNETLEPSYGPVSMDLLGYDCSNCESYYNPGLGKVVC